MSLNTVASPQSHRKVYKMAESRLYMQIATVNSIQINVRQYKCANVTANGNKPVIPGMLGN